MTDDKPSKPDPTVRKYGLPKCPITIIGNQITATIPRWFGVNNQIITAALTDYITVGYRLVSRRAWFSKVPDFFFQAVLVHKDTRSLNLPLSEIQSSLGQNPKDSSELRQMLETLAEDFALPVIDSDRPERVKRPRQSASTEQVLAIRLHDELDMCVADLVSQGRLAVNRNLTTPPPKLAIMKNGNGLRLTFGHSPWRETFQVMLCVLTPFTIGVASAYRPSPSVKIWVMAVMGGAVTVFCALVIFPIYYFLNGNELLLFADRWHYRPSSASLLRPSVQVLSQFKPSEIEGVCRQGRDVLVTSDHEILRIRCRNKATAEWLEQALLNAAAYGLSALDKYVSHLSDTEAGAVNAPASNTR